VLDCVGNEARDEAKEVLLEQQECASVELCSLDFVPDVVHVAFVFVFVVVAEIAVEVVVAAVEAVFVVETGVVVIAEVGE
jgi:hypothetical protein